jgi:uncharacterized SAM-binding protein YcdF (DUF218 family)
MPWWIRSRGGQTKRTQENDYAAAGVGGTRLCARLAANTRVAAAPPPLERAHPKLAPGSRAAFLHRMLFGLKKFIAFWLMPLSLCITLLLVGLLVMRSPRRARLGRALCAAALLLLMLFSNKFVSRWLVRPLETRHPAIPEFVSGANVPAELAACRFVVVLGGGNGNSPGMSANNLLTSSALARIAEAVRLLRVLPDAKLVVSGPGYGRSETHATVLARAAQSLGVAPARIAYIEQAHDTEDEAQAVRRLVGDTPLALVTSAWHMPRSVALFRSAGLEPLPCPADFTSHAHDAFRFEHLLWDIASLERSTWAVRERLGYAWIWLRGKTRR